MNFLSRSTKKRSLLTEWHSEDEVYSVISLPPLHCDISVYLRNHKSSSKSCILPEVEPGLQHVNLSQQQLSVCFNWTFDTRMPLFSPDTLLKYSRPRNPLPSGENHLDYQASVIPHLDFGDQSTLGLHDVQQSSSHMVTPTRAALSLPLSSFAVVSHILLHKWNNSLAYIR